MQIQPHPVILAHLVFGERRSCEMARAHQSTHLQLQHGAAGHNSTSFPFFFYYSLKSFGTSEQRTNRAVMIEDCSFGINPKRPPHSTPRQRGADPTARDIDIEIRQVGLQLHTCTATTTPCPPFSAHSSVGSLVMMPARRQRIDVAKDHTKDRRRERSREYVPHTKAGCN